MFKEDIGLRVDKVEHRLMPADDTDVHLVVVKFKLNPFTKARAMELSEFMARTLFTAADVAVNPQMATATFDLSVQPQAIEVRMAPDQSKPSFVISEAKIGHFRASRGKQSTEWALSFTATFSPKNDHQLAQVVESYTLLRYCDFSDAKPDLFSESAEAERKVRRKAREADEQQATEQAQHAH